MAQPKYTIDKYVRFNDGTWRCSRAATVPGVTGTVFGLKNMKAATNGAEVPPHSQRGGEAKRPHPWSNVCDA